jgi:hypothetical protein
MFRIYFEKWKDKFFFEFVEGRKGMKKGNEEGKEGKGGGKTSIPLNRLSHCRDSLIILKFLRKIFNPFEIMEENVNCF